MGQKHLSDSTIEISIRAIVGVVVQFRINISRYRSKGGFPIEIVMALSTQGTNEMMLTVIIPCDHLLGAYSCTRVLGRALASGMDQSEKEAYALGPLLARPLMIPTILSSVVIS